MLILLSPFPFRPAAAPQTGARRKRGTQSHDFPEKYQNYYKKLSFSIIIRNF
jgi:hypothetical protein